MLNHQIEGDRLSITYHFAAWLLSEWYSCWFKMTFGIMNYCKFCFKKQLYLAVQSFKKLYYQEKDFTVQSLFWCLAWLSTWDVLPQPMLLHILSSALKSKLFQGLPAAKSTFLQSTLPCLLFLGGSFCCFWNFTHYIILCYPLIIRKWDIFDTSTSQLPAPLFICYSFLIVPKE